MAGGDKYKYEGKEPLNREPDIEKLISSYFTDDAFDRNHGEIPNLSAETHTVRVDGAVCSPITLSISQLQNDYPQHDVICALQCAGNRRHTMRTLLKEVQGIDWQNGAVMNCHWRGPKLRDILLRAQVSLGESESSDYEGWHVAFACHSNECQEDSWYGGSIPLERVMIEESDVILALERNHEILSPKHGFPVRALAPGIIGARSVKWVEQITVQRKESSSFYETHDYKELPPEAVDAESAELFWDKVPPMLDTSVNSVVASPASGATVTRDENGDIIVKGYALPAGDSGPVTLVEVSGDGGKTWKEAELLPYPKEVGAASLRYAWVLWTCKTRVDPGQQRVILSRATDSSGNKQPAEAQWNLRGVGLSSHGIARDIVVK